jgi:hypothetical protein
MAAASDPGSIRVVTTTTRAAVPTDQRPPYAIARRIVRRFGWGAMTFLSLGVGAYALLLVASGFRFVPSDVAANHFPTALGLRTHITAAAFALITGPFQFLRPLRRRFPVAHHWIGRVYITACLVAGLAAGSIALFTASGLVAGVGFFVGALAWLATTVLALVAVKRRDFRAHQRWMIRSFALTLAAVTLRIYLPLAMIGGLDFAVAYPVIAWLSWLPNLIIAQLFVNRARGAADF